MNWQRSTSRVVAIDIARVTNGGHNVLVLLFTIITLLEQ